MRLVLLLAVAALASAQLPSVDVLYSTLTYLVYEDGAVQPGPPGKIESAFPLQPGDVFQLRDVEHGLEQMNRLRSSQANANLIAGRVPGTSQIVITEQKADPIRGTIGFDNRGDEATGRTQIRFGMEADDLLRLNDTWSLSYSGAENSNAVAFGASVPFRKWLFSINGSYSESLSPVTAASDFFTQTASLNLTAERLLFRNARSKYFAYATASSYWNERYINIAALAPQHRSALRFGLRQEHRLEKSVIFADTSLSFGTKFLGADRDAPNLPAGSSRAEYRKLGTRLTYIRPYESGRQLSMSLTGQLANAPLYSNEQLSVGGWESVRGYSGFSFSGDSGLFLRTELGIPATALDVRNWGKGLEVVEVWNPLRNAQGGFRPFVFADAGYVKARATGRSMTMLSAGFGFSAQMGLTTLNGTLAVPLQSGNGQTAGNVQAFLGMTVKLF